MKKLVIFMAAIALLFGLVGCDTGNGGGTETPPAVENSDWGIKGSFDLGWEPVHKFIKDPLDVNKITYVLSGLYDYSYEFVLVSDTGKEYKYNTNVVTDFTAGEHVFGDSTAADTQFKKNAKFTAAKKSYVVEVDITTPAAPKVKLIPGTENTTPIDFTAIANMIKIKGDQFSIGWTSIAPTSTDSAKNTITFAGMKVTGKSGAFGFDSLLGFLGGVTIKSPTELNSVSDSSELKTEGGENAKITGALQNAEYDVIITVPVTEAGIYDTAKKPLVSVKLTKAGGAWTMPLPENAWLVGTAASSGDWDVRDTVVVTPATKTAVFEVTYAAAGEKEFKLAITETGYEFDPKNSEAGAGSIYLGIAENFKFTAEVATYTISIDFTNYVAEAGKPIVTVTKKVN